MTENEIPSVSLPNRKGCTLSRIFSAFSSFQHKEQTKIFVFTLLGHLKYFSEWNSVKKPGKVGLATFLWSTLASLVALFNKSIRVLT